MMHAKQSTPCRDCIDGHCTMNCGPNRIAPGVRPPPAFRKRPEPGVCSYCNGTGMVVIRARDAAYAFPGPVPDDARGYADADCWQCDSGAPPEHAKKGPGDADD